MEKSQRDRRTLAALLLCCLVLIASLFLVWTRVPRVGGPEGPDAVETPGTLWPFSRAGEMEAIPGERALVLALAVWAAFRLYQGLGVSRGEPVGKYRTAPMVAGITAVVVGLAEVIVTIYRIHQAGSLSRYFYTPDPGDFQIGAGVILCVSSGVLLALLAATVRKRNEAQ